AKSAKRFEHHVRLECLDDAHAGLQLVGSGEHICASHLSQPDRSPIQRLAGPGEVDRVHRARDDSSRSNTGSDASGTGVQMETRERTGKLPAIENAEPLGCQDVALLTELREVLARHGALGRFGLTLLHEHFPVEDNEVLLETNDPLTRTLEMRPV